MIKLTDEERMEIKEKAIKEGNYKRSLEVVKNMLNLGFAIQDMAKVAGLPEAEVQKIAEKLNSERE